MGKVYLGVDRDLKRTVALKLLSKEKAENPILVKRFKAEGQAAANLNHENIVRVFDSGEQDGQLYLALEYVEGKDAHQVLSKRGPFPVKRSTKIIQKVALALEHAAQAGVVHRDIKPSNIMIRNDGEVKLADMGLARSLAEDEDAGITRAGTTVGTVDYMSPEQARDSKAADIRSDIYSLGATWYQLLTGSPPFPSGDLTNKLRSHATAKRPDPADINDQVPEAVSSIIARMMAIKIDDRYQTVRELLEDLASIKGSRNAVLDAVLGAPESGELNADNDDDDEDGYDDDFDSDEYEAVDSQDIVEVDDDAQTGPSAGRARGGSGAGKPKSSSPSAPTRDLASSGSVDDGSDDGGGAAADQKPARSQKRGRSSGRTAAGGAAANLADDEDDFDPLAVEEGDTSSAAPSSRGGARSGRKKSQSEGHAGGPRPKKRKKSRGESAAASDNSGAERGSEDREAASGDEETGRSASRKKRANAKGAKSSKSSGASDSSAKGRKRALPPRSSGSSETQQKTSVTIDPDVIRNIAVASVILALAAGVGWFVSSNGGGEVVQDPSIGTPYAADATNIVNQPGKTDEPVAVPVEPEPDGAPPVTVISSAGSISPEDQAAIDALPPLAPTSSTEFPDWVGPERILKRLPGETLTVTDDPSAANQFSSLNEAIENVPTTGARIVLSGPGPHRLTPVQVRNVAKLAFVGEPDGVRPIVEMVSSPSSDTVLDLAHTDLVISGVDFFLRSAAPAEERVSWIASDTSTVVVLDSSFTDVSVDTKSTVFDVTSGRVPAAAFRLNPGRTLLVDTTIRGPATTAISVQASVCDAVVGNCYFDSGTEPTVRYATGKRLVTRLTSRDGNAVRRLTVAGSTLFSEGAAIEVEHTEGGVLEKASIEVEQSLLAAAGDGSMLSIVDWPFADPKKPNLLNVTFPRSTLAGWDELVSWKVGDEERTASEPPEWRKVFPSAPVMANQMTSSRLDHPIRNERPTGVADFPQQWKKAIQQRVGAELLQADLERAAWPAEGFGERFEKRSIWPMPTDIRGPIFESQGERKTFDLAKSRLLGKFLEGNDVPDGTEVFVTGEGNVDLFNVDIGTKRVRVVCDPDSEGITLRLRTSRRDSKPGFVVSGGKLEIVNAAISLPPQSGNDLPEELIQLNGGTVALRKCRLVDAASNRDSAALIRATEVGSNAILTDSLLAGPGAIVDGGKSISLIADNVAMVAGETVSRGNGATYLSHCSVRTAGEILSAGDSPNSLFWAEKSVLSPARAVVVAADAAVLRSIDWYGLENVFASGSIATRRGQVDGPVLTAKSWDSLWPVGRTARLRSSAVGPLGLGKPLQELKPADFELPSQSAASKATSDGTSPGIRVASIGPKWKKADAGPKRPSRPPSTILPF